MEVLYLEATSDSPRIMLNKDEGIFEISGRSIVEDTVDFYRPVFEWISAYAKAPNETTHFTFKLEYFNTSSSKLILDMLNALEGIKGIKVVWYFYPDDEAIDEAGKEFAEQVAIPFEFKAVQ